jgi:hypothetical protein
MTREEAASILSNDIIDGHVEGNSRFMDAFWFAVDNLKAEPCEDAVSRQAVLEYIEGSEAELGHSSENELVCQYIKELPPVALRPCEEREQGKCPFYAN